MEELGDSVLLDDRGKTAIGSDGMTAWQKLIVTVRITSRIAKIKLLLLSFWWVFSALTPNPILLTPEVFDQVGTPLVYFLSPSHFSWSLLGELFHSSSEAGSRVFRMHVLCLSKKQWVLKGVGLAAAWKTSYKGLRFSKPGLTGEWVPLSHCCVYKTAFPPKP